MNTETTYCSDTGTFRKKRAHRKKFPRKRRLSDSFINSSQQNDVKRVKEALRSKVQTLRDLIDFAWIANEEDFNGTNKWYVLWNLIPELTELDRMIGMTSLKNDTLHMIMYYIQDMHYFIDDEGRRVRSNNDSLHTAIMGSPGSGKTEVAGILARIYSKLGVLATSEVVHVKITDLIGRFVGHTESKTTELLESAKGKVLFLDEAYSLGASNKNTTSFSEAAINIINEHLERNKHEFAFIIAGYKENLNRCFFSINPGLKRRFRWMFTVDEYNGDELRRIFLKTVIDNHWTLGKSSMKQSFFEENKSSFPYLGGDLNVFFDKCTKAHTKRVFCKPDSVVRKLLTKEDINEGFNMFMQYKKTMRTKDEEQDGGCPLSMYC